MAARTASAGLRHVCELVDASHSHGAPEALVALLRSGGTRSVLDLPWDARIDSLGLAGRRVSVAHRALSGAMRGLQHAAGGYHGLVENSLTGYRFSVVRFNLSEPEPLFWDVDPLLRMTRTWSPPPKSGRRKRAEFDPETALVGSKAAYPPPPTAREGMRQRSRADRSRLLVEGELPRDQEALYDWLREDSVPTDQVLIHFYGRAVEYQLGADPAEPDPLELDDADFEAMHNPQCHILEHVLSSRNDRERSSWPTARGLSTSGAGRRACDGPVGARSVARRMKASPLVKERATCRGETCRLRVTGSGSQRSWLSSKAEASKASALL